MRKTHLFLSCLIACMAMPLTAKMPKLTVVILADGLDVYSVERMRNDWSEGGLYTMVEHGAAGRCSYPFAVYGGNETTASIFTGVQPAEHGYSMDYVYHASDRLPHMTLEDKRAAGIGTTLKLSPRAIQCPTLTDLMRLQYGEFCQVYAIGLKPATTIIMAGHGANGCCWIDPQRHLWVTSSYYTKGLPSAADEMNTEGTIQQTINANKTRTLNANIANEQVIKLALRLQESARLGEDLVPDMLLLELTTLPASVKSDRIESIEHEDTYNRLNEQMGKLITTLQQKLGTANVDFIVIGRPVYGIGIAPLQRIGLDPSQFDCDRMAALTNTYLMALHGNERWIEGVYGQSLYLNRTLINRKHLSLQEMQREVAEFITEFEGIQSAYTAAEVSKSPLASSLGKRHIGDVVFTLEAGWQLMERDKEPLDLVIESNPVSPVYIYSLHHQYLPEQLEATALLKYLCHF